MRVPLRTEQRRLCALALELLLPLHYRYITVTLPLHYRYITVTRSRSSFCCRSFSCVAFLASADWYACSKGVARTGALGGRLWFAVVGSG